MKKQSLKARITNKMTAVLMMASMVVPAVIAKRAHAALGLLALPAGISVVFLTAGAGTTYAGSKVAKLYREAQRENKPAKEVFLLVATLLTYSSGMIMLDGSEEGGAMLEFGSLNAEKAQSLGLTAEEHASFERERLEINAVREETILRSQIQAEKNPELSGEQISVALSKDWKELSTSALSPESVNAVKKISAAGLASL